MRALFSCAIGNTDNHMRNQGFLRGKKGWGLSPAFDVNPTPGNQPKYLSTSLDYGVSDAEPEIALSVCGYFRISVSQARESAASMARALSGWRKTARSAGISETSVERMADCFGSGIKKLRAL